MTERPGVTGDTDIAEVPLYRRVVDALRQEIVEWPARRR